MDAKFHYCKSSSSKTGVIQRRGKFGGPMNAFNQNWESYKDGFGTLNEEFWLGRAYALYDKFWIDNEDQKYKLHISGYSGDAGDSMAYHNGMFFSTKDRDNDRSDAYHCAKDRSSGWWFNYCMECNLNGLYRDGSYTAAFNDGIEWHKFGGSKNSLIATEIKIRPSNKACKRHSSLAHPKIKIP
ncbi:UNVERIFIED_CONTAM: Techylectin-like protein [Trichonephila clavipes]